MNSDAMIANGEYLDAEKCNTAIKDWHPNLLRSKRKKALSTAGDAQSILRKIEDADKGLADVRVNSQADNSRKYG